MKPLVAILYAESRFTPWKENIDLSTVKSISDALEPENDVFVVHMTKPCAELSDLLQEADYVINLCYGYGQFDQAQVASWLDQESVNHLSSSGRSQMLAQDKLAVEKILLEKGIHCPLTLDETNSFSANQFIRKPRYGGCHRGIEIFSSEELTYYKQKDDAADYMIQPYLVGREFSVGVIPAASGVGYEILPPIEIVPFPNNRDIYVAGSAFGSTQRIFTPNLSKTELNDLHAAAVSAHILIGLEYFSRIDFRYTDGIFYVLDVNAMPNMHPEKSMIPAIMKHAGIELKELMSRFIAYNRNQQMGPFGLKPLNSTEGVSNND